MMRTLILPITVALLFSQTAAFAPSSHYSKQSRYLSTSNMAKDENMSEEERTEAIDSALKAMTNFSNKYVTNTGTKYCTDKSVAAVVIKGLAEHKVTLGAPLCPCRYYDDKEKEAKDGYWNCPCVPMRERHECHCMLFLTENNDFAGDETNISVDEVKDLSNAGFL